MRDVSNCLLVLLILIFTQNLKAQSTYTISSSGGNYSSFQEALLSDLVIDGDTLRLGDAVHNESNILITKDVAITGIDKNSSTIQAAPSIEEANDRIFVIPEGKTVSIHHLTMQHGNASGEGGAIYNEGNLSVYNCLLTNNHLDASAANFEGGGAIANKNWLGLYFTEVRSNYSSGHGGGIWSSKSGSYLEVYNCIIDNNETVESGGGIGSKFDANIYIENTLITNNKSRNKGGGVAFNGFPLPLQPFNNITINSTTISKNASNEKGGGLYMVGGDLTIANSIIAENTDAFDPETSDFSIRAITLSKGRNIIGINPSGESNFEMYGEGFEGNSTEPFDPELDDSFTPLPSSFAINYGENLEYINESSVDVYKNPRIFVGEYNVTDIGAVEFQGDPLPKYIIEVSDTIINYGEVSLNATTNKRLSITNFGNIALTIDSIRSTGGFLVNTDGEPADSISSFAIPALASVDLIVSITPSRLGAFTGEATVYSNADNTSTVSIELSATSVDNSDLITGDITEDTEWCTDTIRIGASITITNDATLTICPGTTVEFMDYFDITVKGQIIALGTVTDSIVFTSKGKRWAGLQIDTEAQFDSVNISKFEYARFDHTDAYPFLLKDSYHFRRGGAIFIDEFGTVELNNCVFYDNNAEDIAGAVYNEGVVIINDCLFTNNTTTKVEPDDHYGGGALANRQAGYMKVANSSIENNTTVNEGGAILIEYEDTYTLIQNSYITNNTAGTDGGAILVRKAKAVEIVGCLIADNQALDDDGGALHSRTNSKVKLINTTIVNNQAADDGGAIYIYDSTVDLQSNLFSNNNAGGDDPFIKADDKEIKSKGYNLVDNTANFDFPDKNGDIIGTSDNPINPQLDVDYSPLSNSIAINNGKADTTGINLLPVDIKGNRRIYTDDGIGIIDIGAFEYLDAPDEEIFLAISEDTVRFLPTEIGNVRLDSILLTNIGTSIVEVTGITAPTGFRVKKDDEPFTNLIAAFSMPLKDTVIITIEFAPALATHYDNEIIILSNDNFAPIKTVNLQGLGSDLTILEGEIGDNITLCTDRALVVDTLTVMPGVTYTICEGTILEFLPDAALIVQGMLISNGLETDNVVFIESIADEGWKGIHFIYNDLNTQSSILNYTRISDGQGTEFGAVNVDIAANLEMNNCELSNNLSNNRGGAIHNEGNTTLNNCLIDNNSVNTLNVTDGGGAVSNSFMLELNNTTISNNSSTTNAGAILIDGGLSTTFINNCRIIDNTAELSGAGIAVVDGDSIAIVNSLIANNISVQQRAGGVVTGQSFSGNLVLYNTSIVANQSNMAAGGLYMGSGMLTIWHSIIADNTIIDESNFRPDFFINGETNSLGYNLIGNIGRSYWNAGPNDIFGSAEFPEDPELDAGYKPSSTSLFVNMGDSDGMFPPTDLAGNPRIFDGTVDIIDMGAYELQAEKVLQDLIMGIDTSAINFYAQPIGFQSEPYNMQLSNYFANDYINITSISVPSGFRFSVNGSELAESLTGDLLIPINQSAYLDIVFEPSDAIDYDGELVIESNDQNFPTYRIPISGVGANIKPSFTYTNTPFTIDGALESDWNSYAFDYIAQPVSPVEKLSTFVADLVAGYRASWDDEFLYLLVTVADDSLHNVGGDVATLDNVELYLDFNNSKGTNYDADDYFIRFVWDNGNYIIANGTNIDDIVFAQTTTTDSVEYVFEMAIPWSSATSIIPAAGTEIGIDLNIIDNDGDGVEQILGWHSGAIDKATNPSVLGTAILLDDAGVDPLVPVMNISTDITDFVVSCEESVTVSTSISNNGVGRDLELYSSNQATLTDVLDNLNTNFAEVTALIPNRYNFTEAVEGFFIENGGNDMYDFGNYLNTNFNDQIPYSDNVITQSSDFGNKSEYFTRKVEGLFVLAMDAHDLDFFEINGVAGAKDDATHTEDMITQIFNGNAYNGYIRRVHGSSQPSINHLIITKPNDDVVQKVDKNPEFNRHKLDSINSVTRIYYLLFASSNGAFIDNEDFEKIMYSFLENVATTTVSDAITAGETKQVSYVVPTANLPNGSYQDIVAIFSNDPANPTDSIVFNLDKMGVPDIGVSESTIDFGAVLEDHYTVDTLVISNQGCIPLEITDITSSEQAFFVLNTVFLVNPNEQVKVPIYFYPQAIDTYSGDLSIMSNDETTIVSLTGETLILSSDATLQGITVNGNAIPDFSPAVYIYNYELAPGDFTVPTVVGTPTDPSASVNVIDPAQVPGAAEINVLAEDQLTSLQYIVNIDIATGLDETVINSHKVYPNPVSGKLFIEFYNNEIYELELYDSRGRKIIKLEKEQDIDETFINVSGYEPGVYYLNVKTNDRTHTHKVIKM
ncbi:sugar-binding protein [Carboxylicivirga marina]|uniref:Choice-of-anchor D domain-containing protein n=1 Tax=Carboxylicivirga marina TaxID=2800988 RepID=A0ABS1HDM7_9BACT|nr:sugar-binding protein [Carboxylicivirga marina]MBK3515741.1 choice-of-anchor D domain-containing protein [Carboxylicivirga marina]